MKTVLVENPTCCCGSCGHIRFNVQPLRINQNGGYDIAWRFLDFQVVYCCNRNLNTCQSDTAGARSNQTNDGYVNWSNAVNLPSAFWGESLQNNVTFSACVEPFGDETTTINEPNHNINGIELPTNILVTFFGGSAGTSAAGIECCQYVLSLTFDVDDSDPTAGPVITIGYYWEPCDVNGNWNKAYSDDHDYIPHSCCFADREFYGEYTNFGCKSNDERCDPVEESAATMMSLSASPVALSSTSATSTTCHWATPTDRAWLGNICNCRVIECRCPTGLENIDSYGEHMQTRVRYPTDAAGAAITDAGYYEVRSGYCNARNCLNFQS